MKTLATVLTATLLTAATCASAAPPEIGGARENSRAVMLYFAKSFGSSRSGERAPLAFGLGLRHSALDRPARPMPLLEARFSSNRAPTLTLAGALNFGDSSSSENSSQIAREHPGWTAAAVVAAALAGMCATETWICESGRNYPRNSESPSPE